MHKRRSPELRQASLEKTPARRPDWKNTAVVHVETNERHSLRSTEKFLSREHRLTKEQIEKYIENGLQLLANAKFCERLHQNEIDRLQQQIARIARLHADGFLENPQLQEAVVSSHFFDAGDALGSLATIKEDNQRRCQDQLQKFLESSSQPYKLMTSNSHRTTGDLFTAMNAQQEWDTAHTAILSFDKHHDAHAPGKHILQKSTVLGYLLSEGFVDAVGVVGTPGERIQDLSRFSTPPIQNMYRDGVPQSRLFDAYITHLFDKWKKIGIRQIYPSIDLDGLRLQEVGYTGTDYNPLDAWRLKISQDRTPQLITNSDHITMENIEEVRSMYGMLPTYGVPASWIPRALTMAREKFGWMIGIPGKGNHQGERVVGDVVEYVPLDYKNRTARIAGGIANALLAEAQNP